MSICPTRLAVGLAPPSAAVEMEAVAAYSHPCSGVAMPRISLAGALFLLVGCQREGVPPAPDTAADTKAVQTVLERWYDAIHSYDSTGIAEPLTPTFLLLEDTIPMDKPTLVAGILGGKATGSQEAHLRELKTRVRGDVAWTTMYNHEVWTPRSGAPEPRDFLETVVFERIGGRWRIDRYHAARLHPGS